MVSRDIERETLVSLHADAVETSSHNSEPRHSGRKVEGDACLCFFVMVSSLSERKNQS